MSLSSLVAEARKNTPNLGKATLKEAETEVPLRTELKREMAAISETQKEAATEEREMPKWRQCQYFKAVGTRCMCTQYMSLCAEAKCKREFMETNFFDFKKHINHGKPIK